MRDGAAAAGIDRRRRGSRIRPIARLDRAIAVQRGRARRTFTAAAAVAPGQWDLIIESVRAEASGCSARSNRVVSAVSNRAWPKRSIFRCSSSRPRDGTLAHGRSRSRASPAAAASRKIESGLTQAAGHHRRAAQFHQAPARRRLGATARSTPARIIKALEAHRLSRRIRSRRERAEAGRERAKRKWLLKLPRRRRLCRHERHAAVGLGLVRQRHRHHAGDARPLPLAVGADRAAGRRPMPASRSFAAPCARCARAQLNMDVPISLGVMLALGAVGVRDRHTTPTHAYFNSAIMLLFFLLVRALPRPRRCGARRGVFAGNLAA